MPKYFVWLRINGKVVSKTVSAKNADEAKKKAIKESTWFGGKAEVISVSEV